MQSFICIFVFRKFSFWLVCNKNMGRMSAKTRKKFRLQNDFRFVYYLLFSRCRCSCYSCQFMLIIIKRTTAGQHRESSENYTLRMWPSYDDDNEFMLPPDDTTGWLWPLLLAHFCWCWSVLKRWGIPTKNKGYPLLSYLTRITVLDAFCFIKKLFTWKVNGKGRSNEKIIEKKIMLSSNSPQKSKERELLCHNNVCQSLKCFMRQTKRSI